MPDKTKAELFFQKLKELSNEKGSFVICETRGYVAEYPLNPDKYEELLKNFMDSKTINGLTICEMKEVFTLGKISANFKAPRTEEVRSAIIKHFENEDSIIFRVKDEEGYPSLYYYDRNDLGNPPDIMANHNTIFFPSGRRFYIKNLESILSVGKKLLN